MEINAYLKRLNYQDSLIPNHQTLRQLQMAHLLTIPFENLDIRLKRKIILDEQALFDKIIIKQRGGFCYELNGLFAAFLQQLGFKVTLLSAQVAKEDGSYGREFGHLTLLVETDIKWLVDVGFGDSFRYPLRLEHLTEQAQKLKTYRLVNDRNTWILESKRENWKPEYKFTLVSHQLSDFKEVCDYNQTSPYSIFTQKKLITRATKQGRITLVDDQLIMTQGSKREEKTLNNEEEYNAALVHYFGYNLYDQYMNDQHY